MLLLLLLLPPRNLRKIKTFSRLQLWTRTWPVAAADVDVEVDAVAGATVDVVSVTEDTTVDVVSVTEDTTVDTASDTADTVDGVDAAADAVAGGEPLSEPS